MARKVAGRGGARKGAARKGAARKVARKTVRRTARRAQARGARDDRSDYRNKVQAQKAAAAQSNDGCLPKLFMLTLPFLAVGIFFIARL